MEKEGVLEKVAKNTAKSNGFVTHNLTGFDPWNESSKALADLIEKEGATAAAMTSYPPGIPPHPVVPRTTGNPPPGLANHMPPPPPPAVAQPKNLPPGLTPNHHMGAAANHMGGFNTSMPPPPPPAGQYKDTNHSLLP